MACAAHRCTIFPFMSASLKKRHLIHFTLRTCEKKDVRSLLYRFMLLSLTQIFWWYCFFNQYFCYCMYDHLQTYTRVVGRLSARMQSVARAWKVKPGWLSTTWLCFLVLSSNPLLGMFFGFTPVFWPLYPLSIWLKLGLDVHLGGEFILNPLINFDQIPTVFERRNMFKGGLFTSARAHFL